SVGGAMDPIVHCGMTKQGTLFHYNLLDSTLVIRFLGKMMVLDLPGDLFRIGRVENSLYLHTKDSKLYKATFNDDTKFVGIEFVRNIAK
ncbi:hypothetical protein PFISCL1PPCAC_7073, partial [Pristionchus fissidentatus]